VQAMADGFNAAADSLQNVSKALELAISILKASAFFGLVGNMALAQYLEGIKPNVDRLSNTCDELNHDLVGAIHYLRDGDQTASSRFI